MNVAKLLATLVFRTGTTSHIDVTPDASPALLRVCPSDVYRQNTDGTLAADHAGCLECGACQALITDGLRWRYPDGGDGVVYRHG